MAKKHPFSQKFTNCFHPPTIRCLFFQEILREKINVPLSSSRRKHRKYTHLLFTVTYFQKIQPPNFHCHKIWKTIEKNLMPSNIRKRNDIIYKVAKQLLALYYSLLTFFAFDYLVSLKFTNCFHTSLIGSLRKRIKPDTPLIFDWELF